MSVRVRCISALLAIGLFFPVFARADNTLPALARSSVRPWSVTVTGGTAVPFPSNAQTIRGTVGVGLARTLWRRLELDLSFRLGLSRISTDLAASARAGFRVRVGPLSLSAGSRLGYVAMHVDKGELGDLWTGALLIQPGVDASLGIGDRFELHLRVLTVSAYWNELWFVGWEPSAGIGLRF